MVMEQIKFSLQYGSMQMQPRPLLLLLISGLFKSKGDLRG